MKSCLNRKTCFNRTTKNETMFGVAIQFKRFLLRFFLDTRVWYIMSALISIYSSVVLICTHFMHKKNQTINLDNSSSGKICSYFTVFVPTFFLQCKPPLCRWKIIVNQIWQLGTNEHRRDSCISPNVQMWQLIVTRLISVVHQTVTGTIWHTKFANWWQTVVTFWFNWSISLKKYLY